jgi:hypothetical protein
LSDPSLDDLAELPVWVAWQGETAAKPGAAPKKVPYSAITIGSRASVTNPKTWGPRAAATARAAALPKACGLGGVGIVLTALQNGVSLCGIDLDTCRDLLSGELAPWAEEVITRFGSYTEISPSQTGVKVFFCMCAPEREEILSEIRAISGESTKEGKKWAHETSGEHPPAIELFVGKRYFTVTDERLAAAPDRIRLVDVDTVRWLIREAGPDFQRRWTAQNRHDPEQRPQDNSRSAAAFRKGLALVRRGASYEQMCAALRTDPETEEWVSEKGEAANQRQLKRLYKEATKNVAVNNRYPIIKGALCYKKWNSNGIVDDVPLANFAARITEDQILDDGATRSRRYRISGTLQSGRQLPDALIDASRINSPSWVNEHWGAQAIVYPGAGLQMLEAAIKTVSGEMAPREIFAHFGWRQFDGHWGYLHNGGAIGENGHIPAIAVEIKGLLSHCVLPLVGDLNAAVRASLEMFDIAPVGTLVGAATYRAPLGEICPATLSVHLAGKTGTFKSALAGVAQAHWGSYWDGVHFPANWADTANNIELKAFVAKDMLFGVDEFLPRGRGRHQLDELHGKAERLFRGQANQSGRGRLDVNIKERPVYWPRGLTISSGEDIPIGHSLLARIVVAQVKKGDICPSKLTRLQEAGRSGLLARAMAGYVQWLAGRLDQLRPWFAQRKEELRREAIGAHRRTPQNYAELVIGCELFLMFAASVVAITSAQHELMLEKAKDELSGLMRAQDEEQRGEDAVEIFLGALGSALASGRVFAADWETSKAPQGAEEACGWRMAQQGEHVEWRAHGDRIGWLRGDQLYLFPDVAYTAVERLLNSSLGVSKRTLIRRLGEAGVIAEHDHEKNVKTVSSDGEKQKVLALRAGRVLLSGNRTEAADRRQKLNDDDVPF